MAGGVVEPQRSNLAPGEERGFVLLRGSELLHQQVLAQKAKILLDRYGRENAWPLGPLLLPNKTLSNHVLYVGTTGSGKTTLINQLKRDLLPRIGHGDEYRACIWDYKSEELQYLAGLGLWGRTLNRKTGQYEEGPTNDPCPVYYINPADKRGVGVDIARCVTNEFEADQFATDMISPKAEESGEDMVWIEAARSCLSQVVRIFQERARERWQLIDVVEACYYSETLERFLKLTREGRATLKDTFGAVGQAKGVMFTIQSFAKKLRPIAAAMANSTRDPKRRPVNLKRWVTRDALTGQDAEESIIVIGNNPVLKENLAPLQRWIFGYLARTLLLQEQTESKRYLFFLDEIRQTPFGQLLSELATAGRSKGACLLAGLQDREGLKETMGEENALEFVGMFDTMVFLKLRSVETAEWASKYFGQHLVLAREFTESPSVNASKGTNSSVTYAKEGSKTEGFNDSNGWNLGYSYAFREVERSLVYAGEFRDIQKPRIETGHGLIVEAFVSIADVGEGKIKARDMEKCGIDRDDSIPTYVPVKNEELRYEWTPADLQRLGLPDDLLDEEVPKGQHAALPPPKPTTSQPMVNARPYMNPEDVLVLRTDLWK